MKKLFTVVLVVFVLALGAGASALQLQGQGAASGNFNPQGSSSYFLQPVGSSTSSGSDTLQTSPGSLLGINQSATEPASGAFSKQAIVSEADPSQPASSTPAWQLAIFAALGLAIILIIIGLVASFKNRRTTSDQSV